MAIKISGTTVINDSRDINNIGIVTANIIHLTGGTFNGGGTDTKADTAIVVGENFHIYNLESSGGHLRNLIEKSYGDITIGHADTATVDKISLIPGKGTDGTVTELWAGNASKSVGILTANQSGVTVSGILTATSFSGSAADLTGLTGASAATYGDASNVAQIVVNSDGKITGISNVSISGGGGGGGGVSEALAIAYAIAL